MTANTRLNINMFKYIVACFTLTLTVIKGELSPEEIGQRALVIDKIVVAGLSQKKLALPSGVDDTTFVRRLYFDIMGRPPSYDEIQQFLKTIKDTAARNPSHSFAFTSRPNLIKSLLNSEGYVHHMYSFWADLLRVKRNLNDNVGQLYGDAYIEWLKQEVRDNTPYNKLTHKLLGASGNIWQSPATGYLLRDLGMPLDNLSNTTQIFLGIDMACAQCHDHPFDEWTQMDFYKTAAFFAQVQTKNSQDGVKEHIKGLREEAKKMQTDGKRGIENKLNNYLRTIYEYGVDSKSTGRIRLPDDYAYRDAEPKSIVYASAPYGPRVKESRNKHKREKDPHALRRSFVDWVIADTNPTFALNMTNRLWNHAMGAPVISPMNNVMEDGELNTGKNRYLINYLTKMFIDIGYDVKGFLEIVYNTRSYQRQSWKGPIEEYHFQGPLSRRLTASQLWDSFVTLYIDNPDSISPNYSTKQYKEMSEKDVAEVTLQDAIDGLQKFNALQKSTYSGLPKMGPWYAVRASHINRPGNNLNVLTEFGRSDRRLVDNGSTAGSITQLLLLMNSPLVYALSNRNSALVKKLDSCKDNVTKVYVLFYSIIGRGPTIDDFKLFKPYIEKGQYQDVIWALVNSHEAKFIN